MSNDPYQQARESLAYLLSAPAPPDKIETSLEDQQRALNWEIQARAHRREQERDMLAARAKQIKVLQQQARDMADKERINSVEAWHVAEEQAKKEYVASGGFIEDFKFDRESWIKSNEERGAQIARRLPSWNAI